MIVVSSFVVFYTPRPQFARALVSPGTREVSRIFESECSELGSKRTFSGNSLSWRGRGEGEMEGGEGALPTDQGNYYLLGQYLTAFHISTIFFSGTNKLTGHKCDEVKKKTKKEAVLG